MVQVIASGEVRIVPELPTAMKVCFPYVTSFRLFVVPDVLDVHDNASPEVRIVPELPTVTKVPFPKVTLERLSVIPDVLEVQVVPSDDDSKVPEAPTVKKGCRSWMHRHRLPRALASLPHLNKVVNLICSSIPNRIRRYSDFSTCTFATQGQ